MGTLYDSPVSVHRFQYYLWHFWHLWVSQIAAVWTHLSCLKIHARAQEGLLQPHCTQIIAVFRLLGVDENMQHHLIEVRYCQVWGILVCIYICIYVYVLCIWSSRLSMYYQYMSMCICKLNRPSRNHQLRRCRDAQERSINTWILEAQ